MLAALAQTKKKHKKSDLSTALLVFFTLKALFYKAFRLI